MKAVVFDDERTILNVIRKILKKEGIETKIYEKGENAVEIIRTFKPDIVFLDIVLKDSNGLEILKEISTFEDKPFIVMISGYNDYKYLIEAMKLGAYDYIPKPFDIDKIRKIINDIKKNFQNEVENFKPSGDIIGKSPAMANVFKLVGRVATNDEPVLITGESGTGKEVIANLIHKFSQRADKPFIAINCAAIPENLIESELFGFEKGAFTGATTAKKGKFLLANQGTIFLDEINQLTYEAQGKLLRVIQEKEITPIGSNQKYHIDVKIIAATNEDLKLLVEKGLFREDLYYRLSVFEINIPPLRERKEDIPELIKLFTNQMLNKLNLKKGGFSKETIKILQEYEFPGNIRELRNLVSKLISIYRERIITPDLLPAEITKKEHADVYQLIRDTVKNKFVNQEKDIYNSIINTIEKIIIEEALKECKGNISKSANLLGIHRNTLHKKIKELKIKVR